MARRYRRRRYFKKAKWCPNLQDILNTSINAASGRFSGTTTLTTNPNNSNSTVSQIYTVKNIEITFTIENQDLNRTFDGIAAYIMFVPQGMNVSNDYHLNHPEYIMAYKYLGNPLNENNSGQQFQPIRVRSRLSRKLNTGDSIILYIAGQNNNTANSVLYLSGLIRWWTKAN